MRRRSGSLTGQKPAGQKTGRRVAILAFGSMVTPALAAGAQIDATVVNMRFVKPLDLTLLCELALSHDLLVTVEENVIAGGAGAACAEALDAASITVPLLLLGLPDRFVDHGDPAKLLALEGLDAAGIRKSIEARLNHDALPLKKSA